MFIGHFAVGLTAKSIKPGISLGTYFLAAQFVDLLWPTLLLAGLERVSISPGITEMTPLDFEYYPITHSLLMSLVWALLAFLVLYGFKKDWKVGLLVAVCVVSHWILDFITHRPDLPLAFSDATRIGLGLWNNKVLTIVLESLLFLIGIGLYVRKTRSSDKIGSYGFWGLIGFLVIIHISNSFGPPPPNVEAIAWAGHLQWILVIWAYWVDAHRKVI